MDILQLIDRLEELFNDSRAVPLTRNVMVDEDKMLDIIDQMRIAIPEEVKKAQQLLAQRDRVMAQATEEARGQAQAIGFEVPGAPGHGRRRRKRQSGGQGFSARRVQIRGPDPALPP